MNLLLLGKGKTGSLVADVARERGHEVQILTSKENPNGSALTPQQLTDVDVVIDFTNSDVVRDNMRACIRNRTPMVVGTTGWYDEIPRFEREVLSNRTALLYGSNFSVGVNVFFEIAAAAGVAASQGYGVQIVERHHAQKKDAPSGTAVSLQRIISEQAGVKPEITSVREGDIVGTHVLLLDSENDTMMLVHDAKNRRAFAEGAVRAAEWLKGKSGFYEFRNIFRELGSS